MNTTACQSLWQVAIFGCSRRPMVASKAQKKPSNMAWPFYRIKPPQTWVINKKPWDEEFKLHELLPTSSPKWKFFEAFFCWTFGQMGCPLLQTLPTNNQPTLLLTIFQPLFCRTSWDLSTSSKVNFLRSSTRNIDSNRVQYFDLFRSKMELNRNISLAHHVTHQT